MQPKNNGKQKSAPRKSPKKAEPGAFWVLEGMRTVKGRCKRMGKPGVRTKVNPIPVQHRQKENRRKPSVFAGFVAGAEGLGLGYRLGRFAAERHWRSLTPRYALRRAQPCLVAESLCALTKNREASIVLASLFLAGAEGLEPSARGFGVDVETAHRERGRGSVGQFLLQV